MPSMTTFRSTLHHQRKDDIIAAIVTTRLKIDVHAH